MNTLTIAFRDFVTSPARVATNLWWWVRIHPRLATSILVAVTFFAPILINATAANAADLHPNNPPFYPDNTLNDSAGVPVTNYATLGFDHGGSADAPRIINAFLVDGMWQGYLRVMYWLIWAIGQLLSFTWITWIEAPFQLLGNVINSVLTQTGWVAFALTLTGVVAGVVFLFGRRSAAVVEIFLSIGCAALLAALLGASPVTVLDDGGKGPAGIVVNGLNGAENVGTSAIASLHSTFNASDNAQELATQTLDTSTVSSDSTTAATQVTQGLADTLIRQPAQLITFGKILQGNANDKWNEFYNRSFTDVTSDTSGGDDKQLWCYMGDAGPAFGVGGNGTKCVGGDLDKDAWSFAHDQSSFLAQAGTTFVVLVASSGPLLFLIAFILLVGWATVWALWNLFVLLYRLAVGILPGADRGRIMQAISAVVIGIVLVAGATVLGAAAIEFAGWFERVTKLGALAPLGVSFILFVFAILLFVLRRRAIKSRESASNLGSNWGLRGHSGSAATSRVQEIREKTGKVLGGVAGAGLTAVNPALGAAASGVIGGALASGSKPVQRYQANRLRQSQRDADQGRREDESAARQEESFARQEAAMRDERRTRAAEHYAYSGQQPAPNRHDTYRTGEAWQQPAPQDAGFMAASSGVDQETHEKFLRIIADSQKEQAQLLQKAVSGQKELTQGVDRSSQQVTRYHEEEK